ncbi:MAG: formate acetyltransferase [Armatimonadetes bacterium]|nr:formate acetyltransferase [Armatimonadota bacterium]
MLTYADRLAILRANKLDQVRRKRELGGPRDADEQGQVPLPDDAAEIVEAVSGSGVLVRDVILKGFTVESNHPSGGFFGPLACGANFRRLLDAHPTYLHPANSLAGVYMVNFISYRNPGWNPDFGFAHLHREQRRYALDTGIGGVQHFCPDLGIGLELGWGGLLAKVRHHRAINAEAEEFYAGLEHVILGVQGWIARHAEAARRMAEGEAEPALRESLLTIAAICERQVTDPPATFREACQWLVFFQAVAKMYNGSGEWGQLDELLRPFYERDRAAGTLDDEEAILHLACLLLSETAYIQLGGTDAEGRDLVSPVSFLVLEAAHRLGAPANIGVRAGRGIDPELLRAGLRYLFEDRTGCPKFVADGPLVDGFVRLGYPVELARTRTFSGCHWLGLPGREYTMADLIKIDFAWLFDLSLREMVAEAEPSVAELWRRFEGHLRRAVEVTAAGIDVHLEHMHEVFPELVLDLFCHGPVERGLDVSHGGVEYTNIGIDGASLATAADSFAALEQRIEREGRLTWAALLALLDSNWAGPEGERMRLVMRASERFGRGDSLGDTWAERIARTFAGVVTERPTPGGTKLVPGLFSWARVVDYGRRLGATPDGRRAGEPVSHGPNPSPGCNGGKPGTPSQLALAVARVQPGFGNTAPLQLDLDPGLADGAESLAKIEALLTAHFDLGGTMVNLNVLDRDTLLKAKEQPDRFPDLIVRVTGFSAYFSMLSDELRQYVVDRVVSGS